MTIKKRVGCVSRTGIIGAWNAPYLAYSKPNDATILRMPKKSLTRKPQTRILKRYIFQDRIMNAIHAGITIGVTELRESPTRILKQAEDEDQAVAILNHNKPAGYIISPRMMEAMLDSIADRIAENRAKSRLATLGKARKVKLDEL